MIACATLSPQRGTRFVRALRSTGVHRGAAALLLLAPAGGTVAASDPYPPVQALLQKQCARPGCHSGAYPEQGLSLEPGNIYRDTVNIPARTASGINRVEPGYPEQSLLYLKLLSPEEGRYRGEQMPRMFTPLSDADLALVRTWIESLGAGPGEEAPPVAPAAPEWTFQDSFLVNLPTTEQLGAHAFQFRVAHRFRAPAIDAGADELLGIDSGAWVSLGLAYGIDDRWEVGLRHSTLGKEEEGYFKVAIVEQGTGRPLSLSIVGSLANQRQEGIANETSAGLQLLLARRFGPVSLLAVPMYVSRTNTLDEADKDGTLALGLGGEWHLGPRFAIVGEWIRQLSGVTAAYQSGSLGFGIRTARHAFHLVATNTQGIHADLYAPGGDLDVGQEDFRLGFNITVWFVGRSRKAKP